MLCLYPDKTTLKISANVLCIQEVLYMLKQAKVYENQRNFYGYVQLVNVEFGIKKK
jgi:hypothetical protein